VLIFITLTTVDPVKQPVVLGPVLLRYGIETLWPEEGAPAIIFRDDFAG